jgi:hypothetical protein
MGRFLAKTNLMLMLMATFSKTHYLMIKTALKFQKKFQKIENNSQEICYYYDLVEIFMRRANHLHTACVQIGFFKFYFNLQVC